MKMTSTKKLYNQVTDNIQLLEIIRDHEPEKWNEEMRADHEILSEIWDKLRLMSDFDEPVMLDWDDEPALAEDIPAWITKNRESKGWSRYALAKKVGCEPIRIKEYETGQKSMTVKWWYRIKKILSEIETDPEPKSRTSKPGKPGLQ